MNQSRIPSIMDHFVEVNKMVWCAPTKATSIIDRFIGGGK